MNSLSALSVTPQTPCTAQAALHFPRASLTSSCVASLMRSSFLSFSQEAVFRQRCRSWWRQGSMGVLAGSYWREKWQCRQGLRSAGLVLMPRYPQMRRQAYRGCRSVQVLLMCRLCDLSIASNLDYSVSYSYAFPSQSASTETAPCPCLATAATVSQLLAVTQVICLSPFLSICRHMSMGSLCNKYTLYLLFRFVSSAWSSCWISLQCAGSPLQTNLMLLCEGRYGSEGRGRVRERCMGAIHYIQ